MRLQLIHKIYTRDTKRFTYKNYFTKFTHKQHNSVYRINEIFREHDETHKITVQNSWISAAKQIVL